MNWLKGGRVVAVIASATALFLGGCGKEPAGEQAGHVYGPLTAPPAKFHSHAPGYTNWWENWAKEMYLKGYETAGVKSPQWDDKVREAFTEVAYSRVHGKMPSGGSDAELLELLKSAVEAGCTDPLALYIHLKLSKPPENANLETAAEYSKIAALMDESGYSSLLKCFSNLRASQAWRATSTNQAPQVNALRQQAMRHLEEAVCRDVMPAGAAADACEALYAVIVANDDMRKYFILGSEEALAKRWAGEAFPYVLKGRFYVDYAWEARGGGWSSGVAKEGWKDFEARLKTAENALEKAWKTDPSYPPTPLEMMRVELGQGRGRERMEMWYERAIKFPQNHYTAIDYKLWYLQPRWYGSEEESLRFAREVVLSDTFRGQTPLHLYHTHESLANYVLADRPKYWEEPNVWMDIVSSFERYFQLNGDDSSWRHNYALCAWRCHQWKAFLEQTRQLKWVNHPYFGGKEKYDSMLAEAEKHVKEQVR